MTTAHEKIAQHLHEAHALELELMRTLHTHCAIAPEGAYRSALEHHLGETRGHAVAVAERLRELGQRPGFAERSHGIVQRVGARLAALSGGPLSAARGASLEEQLLRNAKEACAGEALEIATYDALEALARQAGDEATAALAATLRADEERMLEALSGQLPALTAALLAAAADERPHGRGGGLLQAVG